MWRRGLALLFGGGLFASSLTAPKAARRGSVVRRAWPPAAADPAATWVEGKSSGPLGAAADAAFESAFRRGLAAELGADVESERFAAVVDLARLLARRSRGDPDATAAASRRVLQGLFPKWLFPAFRALFAGPLPRFSARLNAVVTANCAQWLMGPCELGDLEQPALAPYATGGVGHVVVVQRCRFLEASACASICVNACKMPTETFFNEDMGVTMRIVPDYDTLRCEFQFGVAPTAEDEREARATPCFAACPSAGKLREPLCPDIGPATVIAERVR